MSHCESTYSNTRPTVPYGSQNPSTALATEQGFKSVRGDLTEGRYLVLEMNGLALTNSEGSVTATGTTAQHNSKAQRWIAHQQISGGKGFVFSSAVDQSYIGSGLTLVADQSAATVFTVGDLGNGAGYALSSPNGYLTISTSGTVGLQSGVAGFSVFSVTYSS
jgi:phospholipase C